MDLHSLQFTIARISSSQCAVPTPALWYRLLTADFPLPLGSITDRVSQPLLHSCFFLKKTHFRLNLWYRLLTADFLLPLGSRIEPVSQQLLISPRNSRQLTWSTVSRPVYLGFRPKSEPYRLSLLSDRSGFVKLTRPLSREDWSVI
jgi:hypothetical protein